MKAFRAAAVLFMLLSVVFLVQEPTGAYSCRLHYWTSTTYYHTQATCQSSYGPASFLPVYAQSDGSSWVCLVNYNPSRWYSPSGCPTGAISSWEWGTENTCPSVGSYGPNEGDVCGVYYGASNCFSASNVGKYDNDGTASQRCVACSGKVETGYYNPSLTATTYTCEVACGANSNCDEKLYSGTSPVCSNNEEIGQCTLCNYYAIPDGCEYDCGADSFCDEHTYGYYAGGGANGCPSSSTCLCATSPRCQAYDGDGTASVCGGMGDTWMSGSYGDYKIDSTGCASGVSCGDGNPSNGFCCGDDSGENVRSETGAADAPSYLKDGTQACCNLNTDCVGGNACYSNGAMYPGNTAYCSSGTWYGPDDSSAACAVLGAFYWRSGSYVSGTNGQCCGDDGVGGANDNFGATTSNPATVTSLTCNYCSGGSSSTATLYGNGYWSGTTCYYGDIGCDSSPNNGASVTLPCSGSSCCVGTNYYSGVSCSDGGSSTGTSYERDNSQSYCESGASGCGSTWLNSKCCGDDGANDDYENAGTGNSACLDGSVLASDSSSGSILAYDGLFYDCNNANGLGIATDKSTCDKVGTKFCLSTNTWATSGSSDGCCAADSDCTGTGDDDFCNLPSWTQDENAKTNPLGDSDSETNSVQLPQNKRCGPAKTLIRGKEASSTDNFNLNSNYSRTQTYMGDINRWQFAGDGPVFSQVSYTTSDNDLCFAYNYDPCSLSTSYMYYLNGDGTKGSLGDLKQGLSIVSGCSTNWIWIALGSGTWGGTTGKNVIGSTDGLMKTSMFSGSSDYVREWQFGWAKGEVGATDTTNSYWCCDSSTDCVDDAPAQGNRVQGDPDSSSSGCYNAGTLRDTGGGDGTDTEECRSGTWYAQDADSTACGNAENTWMASKCCGDDGATDDFENAGTGNSCCINGETVSNDALDSRSQFMCIDGAIYGCNGLPAVGIGTQDSNCTRRSTYYCDGSGTGANTWKTQIANNIAADDCDGSSTDPYGEGHSTALDGASCVGNKMYNDGNGVANQEQGWKCSTSYGPYLANCSLSQNGESFTIRLEIADEADNYNSGGYVVRLGDNTSVLVGYNYLDSGYPGTLLYNPVAGTYTGVDLNEGVAGDYYDIVFSWSGITPFTQEKPYYIEAGVDEGTGTNCGTQTCNTEDPDYPGNNEGSCFGGKTLCVPVGKSATSDTDCCPLGETTSVYPGKDGDGNCIQCDADTGVNNTQAAGSSGSGKCESRCSADASCDEVAVGACPDIGNICPNFLCTYTDRDVSQTYCEDNTGCTAFTWIDIDANVGTLGDNCCGDDSGEDFAGTSGQSDKLCDGGTQYTCVGSTGESHKIGSNWYFCYNNKWRLPVDTADSFANACTNVSSTWTGNECCGNLADTDGDDAGVNGTETNDQGYVDGDYGCNSLGGTALVHQCTGGTDTCFGIDKVTSGVNDTWCVASAKWSDSTQAAESCSEACSSGGWKYLGSQCCGNTAGEGAANKTFDATCSSGIITQQVCCTNRQCSDDNGVCIAEGSTCGGYTCDDYEWKKCEVTSGCSYLDLDNDGFGDKFCNATSLSWVSAGSSTDACEGACTVLSGIWTGQALNEDPKNCCSSSDTGLWCISASGKVTRCNAGQPTDCNVYCDTSATISDSGGTKNYVCSSSNDIDCVSTGCSGSDCACAKGDKTGCYDNSACNSTNCIPFSVQTGESTYFATESPPADTQNGGNFGGMCCPINGCTYDSDGNNVIDKCTANATSSIDADADGDADFCYEGTWKECVSYSCTSATDCSCMSNSTGTGTCNFYTETPGTYSTGTGRCDIQDAALSCATPCDSDGNTLTREYVDNSGLCVKGGGSCQDIYKGISWFGNSSLSFVNVTVDCLCDSQALCTVDVYNTTDLVYTTQKVVSATGAPDYIALTKPFDLGTNTLNVTCGCGASATIPPTSCEQNIASVDYSTSSSISTGKLKAGANESISVVVNNIGSVDLAQFIVGVSLTNGAVSVTNFTTQAYLAKGRSVTVPVLLSIPTAMFNSTTQTISNETTVVLFTNVTDVLLMTEISGSTATYQCDATSDCPTACPSQAGNCWAFGGLSNFTCSQGVCCPNSEHFGDGACCPTGYNCCVTDNTCTASEWCANASGYSSYGIEWSCNDLRLPGQTCAEDRMCDSVNCEAAPVGGNSYCCQSIMTISEVGGECSTLQGEVCSSSGCCTADSECSAGTWCPQTGNKCVACPTSGDAGYFNGYCASSQCKGSDADCCSSDVDCATAESISGASYFCNAETSTCETCTTSLDYYCPSFSKCYQAGPGTGDPDCCSTDSDCFSGNSCVGNTCVPKNLGKYCSVDADCGSGLSCISNGCVLNDFVIVTPQQVDMNVGDVRYATIIVRDPRLKQDTYSLSLSGKYLQFAKIESGSALTISVGPNEVKKYTMVLYGGTVVSNEQIKVFASSQSTPGISSEKTITLNIAQTGGSGLVAAAPGITFREAIAVLIIGGALVWSMKKL